MCKMIVTHMYLPSMWDEEKVKALYFQLKDFDSFEEWYRSELRGHMVQTLMEVSLQSLHIMLQDTDMHDEKAVHDAMVLFRPLDGNVRAKVEHHNTRHEKDICNRYKDNVTASGPDDIACAVEKVRGVEDSNWREEVTAQTKMAKTNVGARELQMASPRNALQLDFKASTRFTTSNYYPTLPGLGDRGYADSSGMFVCVYWGGSVIFVWTLPV